LTPILESLNCATLTLAPNSTVGQLIDAAKSRLRGTTQIVLGVRCGDEEVPPEQLDDVFSLACDTFDTVEVITGNAGEVVADALQVTRRALATTYALTREASERLAEGSIPQAMQSLIECSSTWSRVHQAVVQSCSLLAIDPSNTRVAGRTLAEWLREVAKMLISIRNAMESRDYVLLADILRYEMDDMLGGWEQMLDGLGEYALTNSTVVAA
jgi:hypothetical protein